MWCLFCNNLGGLLAWIKAQLLPKQIQNNYYSIFLLTFQFNTQFNCYWQWGWNTDWHQIHWSCVKLFGFWTLDGAPNHLPSSVLRILLWAVYFTYVLNFYFEGNSKLSFKNFSFIESKFQFIWHKIRNMTFVSKNHAL